MTRMNPTLKERSVYKQRISVWVVGASRSDLELRRDVEQALEEAKKALLKDVRIKDIRARVEPEGGFLGLGAEWVWVLHVLKTAGEAGALGLAGGFGKRAGDKLYDLFAYALRKRNLLPKKCKPEEAAKKPRRRRGSSAPKGPQNERQGSHKSRSSTPG